MEIEIFTLCDFAQDNSGKLTVVGTFDGIHSKQFPFVQANFSVACRLCVSQKRKPVLQGGECTRRTA
jgi:hypothetical protein